MCDYKTEIEWLKRDRGYYEFDPEKLANIFYFSLIWNLFEKAIEEVRGKGISIKNSPHITQKYSSRIKPEILQICWEHFWKRYIEGGQPKTVFNDFIFNAGDNKAQVIKTLQADNPTEEEKLEAILRIIFRLRNNLYHGEKEVEKLYEQNENFKYANQLLMAILDAEKR